MRHIPNEIIDKIICHTNIELACALDNQAAIRHFLKPAKLTVTWAAAHGFTSVIRWLLKNKPRGTRQCWKRGLRKAVRVGHVNVVRLAHELDVTEFTKDTMDLAAKHGQLQVVRFLHEHRVEGCTTAAMDEAAGRGHIEVLRFLHEHRPEGCTPTAMCEAAFCGYIEVVKFLHHNRPEVIPTRIRTHERRLEEVKPLDAAACKGHLEVVQFLHEMKYPCSFKAMDWASAQNHIHVVRYLHKKRKRCSTNALDLAAERGHFEMVRFLHEHRPEGCTFQGTRMAMSQGHEDIARYLINNGAVKDMRGRSSATLLHILYS